MTASDGPQRDAAMRANYSTTVNLEKRQSLNSFIVSVEGTTVDQVVDSLEPSSVILDIGCGNGLWMAPAGRVGDVAGIDLSRPMLRDARARSGNPVACGDAVRLPVRDHTVDVALMLWMLYHVDKPTALQEVTRVLRPGGQVLAATNAASEEGPHAEIIRQALGEVLGREVERWLEPLDFNADNGEGILGQYFESVEQHPWSVGFELHESQPLVDYLDSGRDPIELELGQPLPWSEALATAEGRCSDHIARHGSLRFERRGAAFVAR